MPGKHLSRIVGVAVVGFALGVYSVSLYLAVRGYVTASLLGATIASVALIVGADLVRESG